ncbi:MAG TPA: molybdopterin-dependent oxidoreductase [Candidatus Limnocylindria bacterium]|nr:molybdopterin-dependent oxidoreductase [Candidatus Limnocylindria bacterium]
MDASAAVDTPAGEPGTASGVRTPTAREPRVGHAAIAGAISGGVALAAGELFAAVVPGAPSLPVAIGDLIISLQPPGAKQLVVDIFGTADKLALNLLVVAVALSAAAGLGVLGRRRPNIAAAGFAAFGLLGLAAALRDPLSDPFLAVVAAALAVGVAIAMTRRMLSLAAPPAGQAEMPNWARRRFLGTAVSFGAMATFGGTLGRVLVENRRLERAAIVPVPEPVTPAPAPPAGAQLAVDGLSPLVTPNDRFYRIDTALLVPRPDMSDWRLRLRGLVERPYELTYADLLAMPMFAQYVTIACVSNEVGGDLVGNALWQGVRLRDLLDRAGVRTGATQIVGRAVDGWTAGFPTAWVATDEREAMVAVAMNGEPLPAAHGFPARLIVPGLYGYVSATKWLTEIELTTLEAFDAYWVPLGWAKEAPIKTQSRIDTPRAGSSVTAGAVAVAGIAWAPDRGISRVEVQVDEGTWQQAETSAPISDATWVQWVYRWTANAGDHTLRVRATDGDGQIQTAEISDPPPDGATGHHTVSVSVS